MTDDTQELAAISLVKEITQCHEMTIEKTSEGLDWAIRCGELLVQCKTELGHGRLGGFVEQYLPFSERTARSYMKLHKDLQQLPKRQRSAVLNSAESVNALQKLLPGPAKSAKEDKAPDPPAESESEVESEPESGELLPVPEGGDEDESAEADPFEEVGDPFDEPEKPENPKAPSKPPRQYSGDELCKQWHAVMGPLVRFLDQAAKLRNQADSEHHKATHEYLEYATEEFEEWMEK